jgi:hypothetical protein
MPLLIPLAGTGAIVSRLLTVRRSLCTSVTTPHFSQGPLRGASMSLLMSSWLLGRISLSCALAVVGIKRANIRLASIVRVFFTGSSVGSRLKCWCREA